MLAKPCGFGTRNGRVRVTAEADAPVASGRLRTFTVPTIVAVPKMKGDETARGAAEVKLGTAMARTIRNVGISVSRKLNFHITTLRWLPLQ